MEKLKIPSRAMPVVKILRRDVKRPKVLPRPFPTQDGQRDYLRWSKDLAMAPPNRTFNWCPLVCPMGLHPQALSQSPSGYRFFPLCDDSSIRAFVDWWDVQTDAMAAVDAIWPRKRRKP